MKVWQAAKRGITQEENFHQRRINSWFGLKMSFATESIFVRRHAKAECSSVRCHALDDKWDAQTATKPVHTAVKQMAGRPQKQARTLTAGLHASE